MKLDFYLKIDNLEINNICYSPTIEVLNNKDTDVILIQYNHDHNTVGIFGDSIKDIQISISEQIIDRDSIGLEMINFIQKIVKLDIFLLFFRVINIVKYKKNDGKYKIESLLNMFNNINKQIRNILIFVFLLLFKI